ncbi:MAG: adenylate/guanylate cyclase domain-containing protein [Deltaproteobacteria bacterium]|jgi:class 3 adenylate cyclase|nr:adenylate/guanylate cyclase domain-containing protein [Deltaproteobacteria bacterium]
MVPFKVIRRLALGDTPRVAQERLVREIHAVRILGNCLYSAGSTFIFLESTAPLAYLAFPWFVSLILPWVFSFFALRSSSPQTFIIRSEIAECLAVALVYLASGFSPSVFLWGALLMATNALMTAGTVAGLVGMFTPGVLAYLLASIGLPVGDGELSLLALATHSGAVLIYVFLNAAMGYQAMKKISSLRQQIQSLNQEIKEQVLVRYLPAEMVDDIFSGKIEMDHEPHSQTITVLFSDLSGFTKLGEQLSPSDYASQLNEYLTFMNDIIFGNLGTVDKFMGDAIMVMFGAPKEMPPYMQAQRAVSCARAMQHGLDTLNEKWAVRGLPALAQRIGIHQGTAVVGNFGSEKRSDYTCIGSAVNLASRIETACEVGQVYVSSSIHQLLPDESEAVGEFELKGIEGKTFLYKLVS